MIWFNPAKHHGYVQTDDGERLRVDDEGLAPGQELGDRCRGTRVSFERVVESGEAHAANLAVMPFEMPRRARMRGRR